MVSRKISILISVVLFTVGIAVESQAQVKPPQITPLSPNAASLWKFAQIPVNMYTGLPNISIPIYDIKSGALSVPISLNYHAGGHRYEDQASWVGLGWSISAGGAVNRNVKGKPDEKFGVGLFTQTQPLNLTLGSCELEYYTNIHRGNIDVQPDEFTFSMPGKSGRFVYKQTIPEPIVLPYEPIKITKTYSPDNLSAFHIIDEKGTTFRFGNNKLLTNSVIEKTTGGIGSSIEETMPYPGTWLLTEMESADGTDLIGFNYSSGADVQKNTRASSLTVTEELPDLLAGQAGGNISYGSVIDQNFSYITNTKYLSEIVFENGKVEFVQTTWNRTDLNFNQKALEAINIYAKVDGAYTLVKKIAFTYSYFKRNFQGIQQDWKLKLNKVQVIGKNAQVGEEYSFQYHTDVFSGDEYYFPPFALDFWGFYNGKTANTNLIPVQTFPKLTNPTLTITAGQADRSVDPAFLTEGVLKKIIYPTGGSTSFEYEPHKYFEDAILKIAGGLRVSRITSNESANSGISMEKIYKYGATELGDGFKNFYNNYYFYRTQTFVGPPSKSTTTLSSTPSFQMDGYDGSPVLYPYVTEYFGNTTNNIGKVKYVFDNGSPVQDNLVTSYAAFANLFSRWTNHWKRGLLTSKTSFDKNNNIVSAESSTYQLIHPIDELIGIQLEKKHYNPNNPDPNFGACSYDVGFGSYDLWQRTYIPFSTGNYKLSKSVETAYNLNEPARSIINETNFVYDPNYLQVVESNKILRKTQSGYEEQIIDYSKFPFHYSFTATPVGNEALGIKLLQDKNISVAPIEQYRVKKFKNPTVWQNDIVSGTITTYRSDRPYPEKIWQLETSAPIPSTSFGTGSTIVSNSFTKNSSYTAKLGITKYDGSGNIIQYNKTSDIPNTYLWDYLNTYPVAEIVNADSANIAFTSFEAENKGNWVFAGTPTVDNTAPTGKKVYALNGSNNLVKTGLTIGTTYIVSYWIKATTALTITGTVGGATAGRSLGAWKYYEHRVTGQSQVTITGSAVVDEIRLYPQGAQMTTYTHEPLVGMLSQCDVQNRITYYEYDNLSRLQVIRDQDKNIIKTFEYKYKQ